MSSHHVVREKQEPALLLLGLNTFSEELLGQLLEWSPTVITTPGTAEKLDTLGIKIDWIITDADNQQLQSDVKQLPAGNITAIGAALAYLVEHSYPAVNIVTDELELDDFIPYADKINLVIFYKGQKIYSVNTGFSKWKPVGDVITLLAHAKALKTTGLDSLGNNRYKTAQDGFFTLQFEQPYLFIAEEIV